MEDSKLTQEQIDNDCQLVEAGDLSLDYPECCKPKVYCSGKVQGFVVEGDNSNKQGEKETDKREDSSELDLYRRLTELLAEELEEKL